MPAFSCSSWCLLAFSGFVSRAGHFSLLQTIEPRDLRNRAQGRDPAVPNLANVGLRRNKLIRNKKEGQILWEHEDRGRMRRAGMWGTISKKRSWKMLGGDTETPELLLGLWDRGGWASSWKGCFSFCC